MPNETEDARKTALRFIQYRPRTEQEVRRKLVRKGFGAEVIRKVLAGLSDENMLDDAAFARAWAEERFLSKRFGFRKVRQELALKGVNRESIDSVIGELAEKYDETENALAYLELKYRGRLASQDRQKLVEALLRAGYSGSTAEAAVRTLDGKKGV